MTCKVSFYRTIREITKHHMASVFSVCLVFFIQFIVLFLSIQNYSSNQYTDSFQTQYLIERIDEMTRPSAGYVVPVVFVALLLAFDFFRYLHSKKQLDFYDSLPVTRRQWFVLRISTACIVFIVPFLISFLLEFLLLAIYGFLSKMIFMNLLWNFVCMVLIFLITLFTGVLAMVMTGHPVVALFAFGVFSAYAPILLRYLYPTYANEYFHTYVTTQGNSHYLNYLSPIGLAYKLINTYVQDWSPKLHVVDFLAIIVMIVIVALIAYKLYCKRPSESAGSAMAFPKYNSLIRILLVIPLTLYVGLYLSSVASVGENIWMVFGFVIGTLLLHGIIESIFQFDIRGLWSNKKQMLGCILVSLGFAFVFWFDLFGYDTYMPELNEIDTIILETDLYYEDMIENDGISGEYLDETYQLIQDISKQKLYEDETAHTNALFTMEVSSSTQKLELASELDQKQWLYVEYRLKDGTSKSRQYFMSMAANIELYDKIYATKEYKDDICALYKKDWKDIQYIDWNDGVYEMAIYMTEEEKENLFETYIAEYTPITYSDTLTDSVLGYFNIRSEYDSKYQSYSCPVYSNFQQTIALIEKYMMAHEHSKEYGALTESIFEKYIIQSLEIYTEDKPITISDYDTIETLKSDLIISDLYYKTNHYKQDTFYDVQVTMATPNGTAYTSALLPREKVDIFIK